MLIINLGEYKNKYNYFYNLKLNINDDLRQDFDYVLRKLIQINI
jgi:hypothetical protein